MLKDLLVELVDVLMLEVAVAELEDVLVLEVAVAVAELEVGRMLDEEVDVTAGWAALDVVMRMDQDDCDGLGAFPPLERKQVGVNPRFEHAEEPVIVLFILRTELSTQVHAVVVWVFAANAIVSTRAALKIYFGDSILNEWRVPLADSKEGKYVYEINGRVTMQSRAMHV